METKGDRRPGLSNSRPGLINGTDKELRAVVGESIECNVLGSWERYTVTMVGERKRRSRRHSRPVEIRVGELAALRLVCVGGYATVELARRVVLRRDRDGRNLRVGEWQLSSTAFRGHRGNQGTLFGG